MALDPIANLTGAGVAELDAKTWFTNLRAYLAGLIGTDGLPATARVSLGVDFAQNSQSADYTLVLADANRGMLHPAADNNPRTFTIPANASVAYPVNTCITFINEINTLTIAITSDTLVLAGAGSTGSRTLGAMGMATAVKKTATSWIITGAGLA